MSAVFSPTFDFRGEAVRPKMKGCLASSLKELDAVDVLSEVERRSRSYGNLRS